MNLYYVYILVINLFATLGKDQVFDVSFHALKMELVTWYNLK